MPRQLKKRTVSKIPIHIEPAKLIDHRLLRRASPNYLRTVGLAIFFGLLLGGSIFLYLFYSRSRVEPENQAPTIVLPSDANRQDNKTIPQVPATTDLEISVIIQKVKILPTPTGTLNVRSGPGTNFSKIGQVKPGEEYELQSQDAQSGWLQIKFSADVSGWVTGEYAAVE